MLTRSLNFHLCFVFSLLVRKRLVTPDIKFDINTVAVRNSSSGVSSSSNFSLTPVARPASTDGIDIDEFDIQVTASVSAASNSQSKELSVRCSVWDFAGQCDQLPIIVHAHLHNPFHSHDGVALIFVLLCLNISVAQAKRFITPLIRCSSILLAFIWFASRPVKFSSVGPWTSFS